MTEQVDPRPAAERPRRGGRVWGIVAVAVLAVVAIIVAVAVNTNRKPAKEAAPDPSPAIARAAQAFGEAVARGDLAALKNGYVPGDAKPDLLTQEAAKALYGPSPTVKVERAYLPSNLPEAQAEVTIQGTDEEPVRLPLVLTGSGEDWTVKPVGTASLNLSGAWGLPLTVDGLPAPKAGMVGPKTVLTVAVWPGTHEVTVAPDRLTSFKDTTLKAPALLASPARLLPYQLPFAPTRTQTFTKEGIAAGLRVLDECAAEGKLDYAGCPYDVDAPERGEQPRDLRGVERRGATVTVLTEDAKAPTVIREDRLVGPGPLVRARWEENAGKGWRTVERTVRSSFGGKLTVSNDIVYYTRGLGG